MIPDKIYIRQYCDGETSMFWDEKPYEDEIAGIEAVEYIRKGALDLGWISVKDRLPEKDGWYFTCVEQFKIPQCVGVTYFDKKDSLWLNDIPMGKKSFMTTIEIVDYWMPIPELPKEDIGK